MPNAGGKAKNQSINHTTWACTRQAFFVLYYVTQFQILVITDKNCMKASMKWLAVQILFRANTTVAPSYSRLIGIAMKVYSIQKILDTEFMR